MFEYTFSREPFQMGGYDETYGQTWWAEVNEHLQPVKFNIRDNTKLTIEDKIVAEERTEKKSSKGKEYYQLKKVQVVSKSASEAPRTAQESSSSDTKAQLDRIEAKLDKLLGNPEKPKIDTVVEPVEGEAVSLDDIPF